MAKPLPVVIEELKRSNDDYHTAIDAILSHKDVPIMIKAMLGAYADDIFRKMVKVNTLLDGL